MGSLTFKDLWSRKRRLFGMFTAEIIEAMDDFQAGKMGAIPPR